MKKEGKKSIRMAALGLVCLLTMSLWGCSASGDSKPSTPEPASVAPSGTASGSETVEAFKLPLTETKETLSVVTADLLTPGVSLSDNLPVYQELEKNSNVAIDWRPIKAEADTVIGTMLAAGTDLPDIIRVPGEMEEAAKFGKDGLLMDLRPLIDSYAPNIKKFIFETRPEIAMQLVNENGSIFALPGIIMGSEHNENSNDIFNSATILCRKDWLDKNNLEIPQTIDDFYAALKMMKDSDPNGNGQNDEIPLGFYVTVQAPYSWYYFSGMFGLHLTGGDFYVGDDGKVVNEWSLPQTKEFVETMNAWWSEGLIDPGMPSMTVDKWIAQVTGGLTGFTIANLGHVPSWDPEVKKSVEGGELVAIPLPKGKNGDSVVVGSSDIYGAFGITRDCTNPELAIKWLDYAYFSEEGIRAMEFGVEGVSYEMVDGKPVLLRTFIDEAVESGSTTDAMTRLGAYPNGIMPQIYTKYGREISFRDMYVGDYEYLFKVGEEVSEITVPAIPKFVPTQEESDKIRSLKTDYDTYKDEMVLKFIMGTESMDNWDNFVNTLMNDLGGQEMTDIMQARLDRAK